MPAIIEPSTVVSKNGDVSGVDISWWALVVWGLSSLIRKAGADSPDGRVQRVKNKSARIPRFAITRNNENSQDWKTFCPQNLQFTVHFQRNCLENSKERPR